MASSERQPPSDDDWEQFVQRSVSAGSSRVKRRFAEEHMDELPEDPDEFDERLAEVLRSLDEEAVHQLRSDIEYEQRQIQGEFEPDNIKEGNA